MSTREAPVGEATMPEIPIVIEGLTAQDTQIAALPERPTTPATEIVHSVSPTPCDALMDAPTTPHAETVYTAASDPLLERPESPSTERVQPISSIDANPDAVPDLPLTQSTGESFFNPQVHYRRRLIYANSIVVLVLVIVFCFHQLSSLGGSEKSAVVDSLPAPAASQPVASTQPAAPPATLAELEKLDRSRKTPRLLALSLDEIRPDGSSRVVQVGREPIEAGVVTIVNLWATWCEPCKQELPEFATLLRRSNWGKDVRFTPILIDDKDPVWAHSQFASLMPDGSPFFVDPLQGAVIEVLRESGLLLRDSGLPVTLVYDCNQRARLVYTQGLTAANLEKLEAIVGDLRKELKSSVCVKQHSPSTSESPLKSPGKAAPVTCVRGRCEGDEVATTCDGLKCPNGQRCEEPNGEPRCVVVAGGLKE